MGRKVVVEFDHASEAERFTDEVKQYGGLVSAVGIRGYRCTVKPYRPATNHVTGPVTGSLVQGGNIDGGVHL